MLSDGEHERVEKQEEGWPLGVPVHCRHRLQNIHLHFSARSTACAACVGRDSAPSLVTACSQICLAGMGHGGAAQGQGLATRQRPCPCTGFPAMSPV